MARLAPDNISRDAASTLAVRMVTTFGKLSPRVDCAAMSVSGVSVTLPMWREINGSNTLFVKTASSQKLVSKRAWA